MDYFESLQQHIDDIYFVQVGAMDGKSRDPMFPMVQRYQWSGLLVEPRPDKFKLLQHHYKDHKKNIQFANVAIDQTCHTRPLYYIDDDIIKKHNLPYFCDGISSFYLEQFKMELHAKTVEGTKQEIADFYKRCNSVLQDNVAQIPVKCVTLDQLIKTYNVPKIDILCIDVEGADFMVFNQLDFNQFKPYVICIEIKHVTPQENKALTTKLKKQGYQLSLFQERDLVAVRPLATTTK